MCQECRTNTRLILNIVLPTVAATIAAHNETVAREHPEAYTDATDRPALAEQARAFDLLAYIAKQSHPLTSDYRTPQEAADALRDRLNDNPEIRAATKEINTVVKFCVYAAQILESYAGVCIEALEHRAREEYDHEAIKLVLGDMRPLLDEVKGRVAENVEGVMGVMMMRRLASSAEKLEGLSEMLRSSREGPPPAAPDYRH
jgi:hypothetical protein